MAASIESAVKNISFITCIVQSNSRILICNGTEYDEKDPTLTYKDTWFWVYLSIYVGLVLFAGMMSGLTLGLLSLDMMTLRVMRDGGTATERKYAQKIIPLVKRHHWLLVTLLLANAASVEGMPIVLDRISNPIIAIVISVTAVLIFGEVLPQAACSRYGLAIGAAFKPIVYGLMFLLAPLAWPLSKLLDCVLGHETTQTFRRNQLKVLVDIHGESHDQGSGDRLTTDEVLIIKGALDMKNKHVCDAMLPLERVFMIPDTTVLDKENIDKIMYSRHSRVPIYHESHSNITSLLLAKRLMTLQIGSVVRDVMKASAFRVPPVVDESMPLYELLNIFQDGKSHLAVVKKSNFDLESSEEEGVTGIITLEDILEQLLQEPIWDETDLRHDIRTRLAMAKVQRQISVPRRPNRNYQSMDGSAQGATSDTVPLLDPTA